MLLLTSLFWWAPLLATAQEPGPTPEEIEAAVAALEQGFEEEELADTLRAVERSAATAADAIAQVLVRAGLDHRERDVRLVTFDSLARIDREPGRKALERMLRRERDLTEDPELMIAALRALARHGDPRSIHVLADLSRSGGERSIVRARILCLGLVRDPSAAEALFAAMKKAGPEEVQRHMPDFRLALMVLLAVDRGISQAAWLAWWNEQRGRLEVAADEPRLPDAERAQWRRFQGLEPEYPRPEKRRERGR